MYKYLVIYEKARDNYSAYSPDLPGCVATGKTREEVEKNMKDAISLHIEGLEKDGLPLPEPASFITLKNSRSISFILAYCSIVAGLN